MTSPWIGLRRLGPGAIVGVAMLVVLVAGSISISWLSPFDPVKGGGARLSPPSTTHWFGTDNLGRDVFARTFAAARLDILIAVVAVAIPLTIGTVVGAFLGAAGKSKMAATLNFIIEGVSAFPFVVLALGVIAVVGAGVFGLVFAIAVTNWARYARIAKARSTVVAGSEYIDVTALLGYSRARVMVRHLLPNVSRETSAYALSDLVLIVLTVAALSFLGAGVRPPTAEWGAMIAEGRLYLMTAWWMSVFPGLALASVAFAIQLIADGREEAV